MTGDVIKAFLGLGIFFLALGLLVFTIVMTVTGIYLAFSASLLLGVLVLLVEPAPLVLGLFYWFGGVDLAAKLLEMILK